MNVSRRRRDLQIKLEEPISLRDLGNVAEKNLYLTKNEFLSVCRIMNLLDSGHWSHNVLLSFDVFVHIKA